ncbi:MAG: gpW family head-tail joining protein [Proteobacteria bacterium]|nr:gpW family head-tail joining protein [Pseudomonadota bacterium]
MTYTETDLQAVQDAITKLQNGERVVQVAHDGHVVKYAGVELDELLALRNQIKTVVKIAGQKHKRRIQIISNKGVL